MRSAFHAPGESLANWQSSLLNSWAEVWNCRPAVKNI